VTVPVTAATSNSNTATTSRVVYNLSMRIDMPHDLFIGHIGRWQQVDVLVNRAHHNPLARLFDNHRPIGINRPER